MKTVFIYTQKKRMFHEKNLKRANADPVVLKSIDWIWISYKTKPTEVWANIRAGLRVRKRSHGATCRRPSSSTVKKSTVSVPQMGPTSSEIATSSAIVVSLCLSVLFCIKISETALEFYTLYLRPLIFLFIYNSRPILLYLQRYFFHFFSFGSITTVYWYYN